LTKLSYGGRNAARFSRLPGRLHSASETAPRAACFYNLHDLIYVNKKSANQFADKTGKAMNNDKDYLSEFEREFELNDFSSEYDGEMNASEEFDNEFENDFSSETNDEFETQDEYELNDEYESEDEYEFQDEQSDSEMENYLQEYDSPDREFEDRIYSALNGEHESSFEMEQELDRVLHEMEVEYFWKAAKGFWNKHKKKLMKVANLTPLGGGLSMLAKAAGGDLRGLLKKGAMMAANAYLPGVGGAIAGKLLNSETAAPADPRAQAQQVVQVAKDAYRNMAGLVPNLRPGNIPNQISRFSRQALTMARNKHSGRRRGGKGKRVIRLNPGSTVVVKRDRIIIY